MEGERREWGTVGGDNWGAGEGGGKAVERERVPRERMMVMRREVEKGDMIDFQELEKMWTVIGQGLLRPRRLNRRAAIEKSMGIRSRCLRAT